MQPAAAERQLQPAAPTGSYLSDDYFEDHFFKDDYSILSLVLHGLPQTTNEYNCVLLQGSAPAGRVVLFLFEHGVQGFLRGLPVFECVLCLRGFPGSLTTACILQKIGDLIKIVENHTRVIRDRGPVAADHLPG